MSKTMYHQCIDGLVQGGTEDFTLHWVYRLFVFSHFRHMPEAPLWRPQLQFSCGKQTADNVNFWSRNLHLTNAPNND